MSQASYIDATDIAAYGFEIDLSTNQALFDKLRPRASRLFDILCGVEPGAFAGVVAPIWQSLTVYAVGDMLTPRTLNGHRYQVTQAGTSGSSEPTYPTSTHGTVNNGSIILTEAGSDAIASSDKIVYGSGGVLLALPAHVGLIGAIVPASGFVLPPYVEMAGNLRVTDSLGRVLDVGVPSPNTGMGAFVQGSVVWQRGVAYTITAVWGYESTPDAARQATVEIFAALWRSKDPVLIQATALDSNQMMFNPAIPKRAKVIARSFKNQQPMPVFV